MKKLFLRILLINFVLLLPFCYANTGSFNLLKTPDNNILKNKKCCLIGENSIFISDKNGNNIEYSILDTNNGIYTDKGVIKNMSNIDFIPLKNGNIFMFGIDYNKKISDNYTGFAGIFNLKTKSFEKLAEIECKPASIYILELENGNIFINLSNKIKTEVLEFDINNNVFKKHSDLKEKRYGHNGLEISPNKVMLLGGEGKNIEIYNLSENTSEIIDVNLRTVFWGDNTKIYPLNDNKYLIFVQKVYYENNGYAHELEQVIDINNPNSGYEKFYHHDFLGILNLNNKSIEEIIPDSRHKISDYNIELLPDNNVLIIGGSYGSYKGDFVTFDTVRIYNTKTKKISLLQSKMHYKREGHKTLKLSPNRYLIYEGVSDTSLFPKPEIFQYK